MTVDEVAGVTPKEPSTELNLVVTDHVDIQTRQPETNAQHSPSTELNLVVHLTKFQEVQRSEPCACYSDGDHSPISGNKETVSISTNVQEGSQAKTVMKEDTSKIDNELLLISNNLAEKAQSNPVLKIVNRIGILRFRNPPQRLILLIRKMPLSL